MAGTAEDSHIDASDIVRTKTLGKRIKGTAKRVTGLKQRPIGQAIVVKSDSIHGGKAAVLTTSSDHCDNPSELRGGKPPKDCDDSLKDRKPSGFTKNKRGHLRLLVWMKAPQCGDASLERRVMGPYSPIFLRATLHSIRS
jgi:hypothetical protein